jgi:IS4 transposase
LRAVGENYRDDYAPRMNWQVTMPVTLDGQTRDVAHVKEIVKYYAQRRGVLTFASASSTALSGRPRTRGTGRSDLRVGGKVLRILCNDLDASAGEIAELYKRRWAIELFFR